VDIWSLGATLFNLVVGRPPWVASNQIVLAHQIQHVELSFPPEAEDLDPHLKNLLRRMLTKDPDRRISMDDVINHEWVTDEGADPLVDIKALRPAMLKQQSVQVTEFEVQQAVVMPPSVMR
jgi:serine/threonine protein kinase